MADHECFYMKSASKDADGKEYVIAHSTKDKYAPKTTGVYNIEMQLLDPNVIKKS